MDTLVKETIVNDTQESSTKEVKLASIKSNVIIKIYLVLVGFVIFGTLIFLVKTILLNRGVYLKENSPLASLVNIFLTIWGIIFAYLLPFGVINLGLWSIIYKESAIRNPVSVETPLYKPPVKFKGNKAVFAGVFYIILGLMLAWGVTGILLGLLCNTLFCVSLPSFIKFF